MATENATTTDDTSARYDALNDGERALGELHALSDILLHTDGQNLAQETVPTIGAMLDTIAERLQDSMNVLYGRSKPVGG